MLVCLACYEDRVAALLENATELRFFRAADGQPLRAELHSAAPLPPPGQDNGLADLIRLLKASGAGVLLCGGLTCCAQQTLLGSGVQVEPWIGGAADEVALAWLSGRIQTMKMPGCTGCGRALRWRRRGLGVKHKERRPMLEGIIAVTSEGPGLNDRVDPRFGRAAGFVVVDLATRATSYIDNGGSQALAQGAGIQAAENVAKAGAGVVLSGFVGPKAFQALAAAGIKVIQNVEDMTVAQAVEKFRRGELAVADAPNAPAGGHPGGGHRGGGRA